MMLRPDPADVAAIERALTTARLNLTRAVNDGRPDDVIAAARAAVLREQGRLQGVTQRSTG